MHFQHSLLYNQCRVHVYPHNWLPNDSDAKQSQSWLTGCVLYANLSSDGHSSASVEVMDTGMYQVSVLPIVEGVGITESVVEHREIVMVFESPTTMLYTGTCTNIV